MIDRYIPEMAHLMVDEELQPWIDAFSDADSGNKRSLIRLLRANTPIPWPAPWHLADLLDRYNLTKRQYRGGQKTPSYDYPPALRKLVRAKKYYDREVARGRNKDTAFDDAARIGGVREETLRMFVAGKYASARRIKKRKPPPNPRP